MTNFHKAARCLLLTLILVYPCVTETKAEEYVGDQLVCKVSQFGYIDSVNTLYGTTVIGFDAATYVYLLQIHDGSDPDSLAPEIKATYGFVQICEPNYLLEVPEGVQSSSPFLDEFGTTHVIGQTARSQLKLSPAQQMSSGSGVTIGVVDGGIDFGHSSLAAVTSSGYDFVDNDTMAFDEAGGAFSGHGTFVAGLVHLVAPESQIISYRVLGTDGRGDGFSVAQAVTRAIADSCKVINLSLAMSGENAAIRLAVEYARQHNAVVVAAAGNDSANVNRYPASDTNAISVAAVDSLNEVADFSNFGISVDVCAPGTHVFSTFPGNEFARWDGTSFAAPFVTGQLALVFAIAPETQWENAVTAIESTGIDIDSLNPELSGLLGSGLAHPPASLKEFGAFICGDINQDFNGPDITDLAFLVNYMFRHGPTPEIIAAVDVNSTDGPVNISDLTFLVQFMFRQGAPISCIHGAD